MRTYSLLAMACLAEIAFAVSLKLSDGMQRPVVTAIAFVFGAASFILLGLSLKGLPLGSTYAIWTGFGIAGSVVVGSIALGESLSLIRLAAIAGIVASAIVLLITDPTQP